MRNVIATLSLAAFLTAGLEHPAAYFNAEKPLIIAHRGASGFVPEHTLQAFSTGVAMGADFIEPDVLVTKDNQLVVNHDVNLVKTSDVADHPEFACRAGTRMVEHHSETGWFSDDFTLAEFKTLRARQRYEFRDHSFDDLLPKVSLTEVLDLALKINAKRRETKQKLLGVYIETKYPDYFQEQGFDMERLLYEELLRHNLGNTHNATMFCPVILQSFSARSLRLLKQYTDLPLVYLVEFTTNVTLAMLKEVGEEFHGLGPHLIALFDRDLRPTGLLEQAHKEKLKVHPYTLKDDSNVFTPPIKDVYTVLLQSGLDGIFSEFPDSMHVWLEALNQKATH